MMNSADPEDWLTSIVVARDGSVRELRRVRDFTLSSGEREVVERERRREIREGGGGSEEEAWGGGGGWIVRMRDMSTLRMREKDEKRRSRSRESEASEG